MKPHTPAYVPACLSPNPQDSALSTLTGLQPHVCAQEPGSDQAGQYPNPSPGSCQPGPINPSPPAVSKVISWLTAALWPMSG